ncbi:enoyl-CoA hydratase/isomerase family protein [Chloroflexota bacterium]
MTYETLIVERGDNIGIITLNRPPANPINRAVLEDLDQALTELEGDKAIRALIITGAGEKGFSAGFDVKTAGTPESEGIDARGHEVFSRIEKFPKPVIAAINGYALGGGCELSMACHFRIMVNAERAIIGQTEIDLGIIPGWGGTQRLPRLVGKTKALEMLLLGTRISPLEALEIGLVTRVSQPGEVMKDAKEFAKTLAKKAPLAVRTTLDVVTRGLDTTLEEGLKIELESVPVVEKSKDAEEGIRAFVEKREPVFKGE